MQLFNYCLEQVETFNLYDFQEKEGVFIGIFVRMCVSGVGGGENECCTALSVKVLH